MFTRLCDLANIDKLAGLVSLAGLTQLTALLDVHRFSSLTTICGSARFGEFLGLSDLDN